VPVPPLSLGNKPSDYGRTIYKVNHVAAHTGSWDASPLRGEPPHILGVMRKNKLFRYVGFVIAWGAVVAWLILGADLSPEHLLSAVIIGGALAAVPDGYALDKAKAAGWLLILLGTATFVASGMLFERFAAAAILVAVPLVISGTALAGLLSREDLGQNG